MPLDNRKLKILNAIVESYILTGEPVASKRLAQMLDVSVSPATVRNDMAVLFDMGLLEQPHTSAGRVPSHLGYRVYVDRLMRRKPLSVEEKRQIDALFNV
ncbi:MAG: heat-inducible transcription repressor HrcA, partial [Oscillospiraceae bacterium]